MSSNQYRKKGDSGRDQSPEAPSPRHSDSKTNNFREAPRYRPDEREDRTKRRLSVTNVDTVYQHGPKQQGPRQGNPVQQQRHPLGDCDYEPPSRPTNTTLFGTHGQNAQQGQSQQGYGQSQQSQNSQHRQRVPLTATQQYFLGHTPLEDIRAWMKMITNHPEFFDDTDGARPFVTEAIHALVHRQIDRYRACVKTAALFQLVGNKKPRIQDDIFYDLNKQVTAVSKDFKTALERLGAYCQAQAQIIGEQSVTKDDNRIQQTTSGMQALAISSATPGRHTSQVAARGGAAATANKRRHNDDTAEDLRPLPPGKGVPIRTGDPDDPDNDPSIKGPATGADFETLDRRFERRDPNKAGKFFKVGRVFAIITHSDHGNPDDGNTSPKWTTRKGDLVIYSHVNRFAVVREGHGFCWAVPINTYEGRATTKPGFNERDRQAHAIIHDTQRQPQAVRGEGELGKRPISIVKSETAEVLHPASRINFQKVSSIEHNVRAMSVGKVSEASIGDFERYWKQHLLG